MPKYLVETFYTCTFKIVHKLDELSDKKLSELENSNDGKFELIDVKLNNRKTKAITDKNLTNKIEKSADKNVPDLSSIFKSDKINKSDEKNTLVQQLTKQNHNRSKMPDRRKGYIQKVTIGDHKIYLHTG